MKTPFVKTLLILLFLTSNIQNSNCNSSNRISDTSSSNIHYYNNNNNNNNNVSVHDDINDENAYEGNNSNNSKLEIVGEFNTTRSNTTTRRAETTTITTTTTTTTKKQKNKWIFGKPYWISTIDDVGEINYKITYNNPLKGMCCNPNIYSPYKTGVFFTLDGFYIGLDTVLIGPAYYNWTEFDLLLTASVTQRQAHTIPRFFIHYPKSTTPIRLPEFLDTVEIRKYGEKNEFLSPYYGDKKLLKAIQHFIYEFGKKYDGDTRIAFIQAGLLGFWGEFHTNGYEFLLPESVKIQVLQWYHDAFTKTPIQQRYPEKTYKISNTIHGYHDDSYAYATLDGKYNGGIKRDSNFWNRVQRFNDSTFWKTGPMGGEVRPTKSELIFKDTYPVNTEFHNDVYACINITHTTYLKNDYVFRSDTITSKEVNKVNELSSLMGYTFYISKIEASEVYELGGTLSTTYIDIVVVVANIGVAPYYYDLGLSIMCLSLKEPIIITNIQKKLIEQNKKIRFLVRNIPRNRKCLNTIEVSLTSSMADIIGNVIRLAQRDGSISIAIPLPPTDTVVISPPRKVTNPILISSPIKRKPVPAGLVPVRKPIRSPTKSISNNNNKVQIHFNLIDANTNKFLKKSLQNNEYIDLLITGTSSLAIQVDIDGL